MAITAIKYVFNQSNRRVSVHNRRTGEISEGWIDTQNGASFNTWIEWCVDRQQFLAGHYIEIVLEGPPYILFAIWQQDRWDDGDYVRVERDYNEVGFNPDAPPIRGNGAEAGGDRILRIIDDDTIFLDVLGAPPSFLAEVASEETRGTYFQRTPPDPER